MAKREVQTTKQGCNDFLTGSGSRQEVSTADRLGQPALGSIIFEVARICTRRDIDAEAMQEILYAISGFRRPTAHTLPMPQAKVIPFPRMASR